MSKELTATVIYYNNAHNTKTNIAYQSKTARHDHGYDESLEIRALSCNGFRNNGVRNTIRKRTLSTYQSEAARHDHRYDESLEVRVFDKLVHVAAIPPKRPADGEVIGRIAA